MSFHFDFFSWLPLINIVGFIVLVATIVYYQRKLGVNKVKDEGIKVSSEVINAYKEQVQQLREEISKERDAVIDLGKQLVRLQTESAEKDRKIQELTKLLTDKDPSTLNTLLAIKKGIDELNAQGEVSEKQRKQVAKTLKNNKGGV